MQSVNSNKNGMVAIYCRLSSDDGRDGESNSIINQKAMLEKYVLEKQLGTPRVYVDDGFTGTNFNRPGFMQMREDMDKGYIHTVIVKDECVIIGLNRENPVFIRVFRPRKQKLSF